MDEQIRNHITDLYGRTGEFIEKGYVKQALENLLDYVRTANRYFDQQQPWIQIKDDLSSCEKTLATCVYIISNLSQLLQPFLPFSTEKIREMLGIETVEWKEQSNSPDSIKFIAPLFERLDVGLITEEYNELVNASKSEKER